MRISVGAGTASGLAVTILLTLSTPGNDVVPANARQSVCDPNTLCANDSPPDGGDQATAEQKIIDGYKAKQISCTPSLPPNPQSITWDPPGFAPSVGGTGTIRDANPQLGGQYRADYVNGRWHIEYPYC
ncbi:hypothetical protein MNAB215_2372 [Mycobacterium numidiamassiliense]|jgi:hypothetical protein|uniref:Uncharacterized protein n=1 Tax=Mycobacterium numidiamassiliense TaxID=1841861 RepID=A0A2U3P8U3_9MYCO|nr:integrase [Mycobacterium numidiamassiliense]SPM40176.1 hypothetical protein MNAB215_2372 [Mycobacterium numidiamassiliense]